MSDRSVLMEIRNLKKYFPIKKGFWNKTAGYVKAVDDVSFYVEEGETLGLVGESGCGKTTLGRCIVRGIPASGGEVLYTPDNNDTIDFLKLDRKALKDLPRPVSSMKSWEDSTIKMDSMMRAMNWMMY